MELRRGMVQAQLVSTIKGVQHEEDRVIRIHGRVDWGDAWPLSTPTQSPAV